MQYAKITDGKLEIMPASIEINGMEVINPTAEQALSQGWYPFYDAVPHVTDKKWYHTVAKPELADGVIRYAEEEVKDEQPDRDALIVQKIRENYTLDEELAIQRQRDTKPDEFEAYFAVCEDAKVWADSEIAEWSKA